MIDQRSNPVMEHKLPSVCTSPCSLSVFAWCLSWSSHWMIYCHPTVSQRCWVLRCFLFPQHSCLCCSGTQPGWSPKSTVWTVVLILRWVRQWSLQLGSSSVTFHKLNSCWHQMIKADCRLLLVVSGGRVSVLSQVYKSLVLWQASKLVTKLVCSWIQTSHQLHSLRVPSRQTPHWKFLCTQSAKTSVPWVLAVCGVQIFMLVGRCMGVMGKI